MSELKTEPVVEAEINEKDKPFILALIASVITGLTGLAASLNLSFISPQASMDIFKATLTLTATAWGYYFAKKE